jgi:hypothetical protein
MSIYIPRRRKGILPLGVQEVEKINKDFSRNLGSKIPHPLIRF